MVSGMSASYFGDLKHLIFSLVIKLATLGNYTFPVLKRLEILCFASRYLDILESYPFIVVVVVVVCVTFLIPPFKDSHLSHSELTCIAQNSSMNDQADQHYPQKGSLSVCGVNSIC